MKPMLMKVKAVEHEGSWTTMIIRYSYEENLFSQSLVAAISDAPRGQDKWTSILEAVRNYRFGQKICNCRVNHLTMQECRRARRFGKTEARHLSVYQRDLPDGFEVVVYPMIGGQYRLCLSEQDDRGSIIDAFCYYDSDRVLQAARVWTGEGDPLDGWYRNPLTGRRRENGDPTTERFWM